MAVVGINGLYLTRSNTGGGRYLHDLIANLRAAGQVEKYVLFLNPGADSPGFAAGCGVEICRCPRQTGIRPLRLVWEHMLLPRLIRQRNISLLHCCGFTLPRGLPSSVRSVLTVFDMTFFTMPRVHQAEKVAYFRALLPWSLKRADRVIALSGQTKRDIVRCTRTPADKIDVVPVGVHPRFSGPLAGDDISRVLGRYGIPREYLLFVGTLEPRKNVAGLLEAYALLKRGKCACKLVIVGKKGWHYNNIFERVIDQGLTDDIIFTGYVPDEDMPALYRGASVFIYPSFYEGFGIPVLEAMSSGVPVITSRVSSLPEVAQDAAWYVDPYRPGEIAEAVQGILRDPACARRMADAGRKRALHFGLDSMAQATQDVYLKTLSGGNHA
ncbi:MAG: glycosyltransferase family 4 protein [Candidatus Omnitrophica bacterium]|nr:glycosyltransferase family 4 protein [Candidatus Omnitrophota bacterium]